MTSNYTVSSRGYPLLLILFVPLFKEVLTVGRKAKYSIEDVRLMFQEQGYTLMEDFYKDNRTKMKYICPMGHDGSITLNNFQNGHRCYDCGREIIANSKRLHYGSVRRVFEDAGCVLLSDTFNNTHEKLTFLCKCGRESKARYDNFLSSKQCSDCTYEQMSGSNHPNFNPNLTDKERKRSYRGYKKWVKSVLDRDERTCRKCGEKKYRIVAHHLDGHDWCIEKRLDADNGVTLCGECHDNFHSIYGLGGNTREQYDEWIK